MISAAPCQGISVTEDGEVLCAWPAFVIWKLIRRGFTLCHNSHIAHSCPFARFHLETCCSATPRVFCCCKQTINMCLFPFGLQTAGAAEHSCHAAAQATAKPLRIWVACFRTNSEYDATGSYRLGCQAHSRQDLQVPGCGFHLHNCTLVLRTVASPPQQLLHALPAFTNPRSPIVAMGVKQVSASRVARRKFQALPHHEAACGTAIDS